MSASLSKLLQTIANEPNLNLVFEEILTTAQELTGADAGTYYSVIEENGKKTLRIDVMDNKTLNIHLGGKSKNVIPNGANRIPLYLADNRVNSSKLVVYSVMNNLTINVGNVQESHEFDFSATYGFDKKMGYETISILTVPVISSNGKMIGAIQLINALDTENYNAIPFNDLQEMQIKMIAEHIANPLASRKLY